jgi:hypothetical protein
MSWRMLPLAAPGDVERNLRALDAFLRGGAMGESIKLGADVGPTNATGLANVTGVSFAVAANTDYRFEFLILFQSNNVANGPKFALTSPAGSSITYHVTIPTAADGTDADYEGQGTTSGDTVQVGAVPAASTTYLARIVGILQNAGTAGTLQLQHASVGAGATVTTKAGTSGLLTTLP